VAFLHLIHLQAIPLLYFGAFFQPVSDRYRTPDWRDRSYNIGIAKIKTSLIGLVNCQEILVVMDQLKSPFPPTAHADNAH
jgi:hypothetical protein